MAKPLSVDGVDRLRTSVQLDSLDGTSGCVKLDGKSSNLRC